MKYFRLKPEVYYVHGEEYGCIYDLIKEKVYRVDNEYQQLLLLSECNVPLEYIKAKINMNPELIDKYYNDLYEKQLGDYYDKKIYIEKVNYNAEWKDKLFFKMPPKVDIAFIELSNDCPKNCKYCKSHEHVLRTSCFSCVETAGEVHYADRESMNKIIDILINIHVKQVIFTGGNVLNNEVLPELIEKIHNKIDNITIITDFELALDYVKSLDWNIDFIMQYHLTDDYIKELENIIDYQLQCKQNIRWLLILDYKDKNLVQNIANYLISNNISNFYFDYILNVNQISVQAEKIIDGVPTLHKYSYRNKFNTCLGRMISIKSNGMITTCPSMIQKPIGKDFDLIEAFLSDEYKEQIRLNANKITPCNSCSLRYLCCDCRYLELLAGSEFNETKICQIKNNR